MENLQNLSNELDNIKNRIKDSEYKTIMELLGKIHNEEQKPPKRMVKVLEIKANVYAYVEHTDGESIVDMISDFGFRFKTCGCGECNSDSPIKLMEVSKPDFRFKEYNLRVEPVEDGRPSLDTDMGYMEENYFEEIKANKRLVYDDMVYIFLSESEE
jgi:hypothetical protein